MTGAEAAPRFESADAVAQALRSVGYLADPATATAVFLADRLDRPLLLEGPAGTGKTALAKAVAAMAGSRLIRLQCYEGLDEAKALYEWNYRRQLLHIQSDHDRGGALDDIFTEDFLLARPLLEAIRSPDPVVLLIDEVDRVEVETEALLLEVLSDWQVSIPELGTVSATALPLVFLTSNSTRELSEALRRRCLYLHLDYPDAAREAEIIRARIPGIDARLAEQVAGVVRSVRGLELTKAPSVSETLDWARTLVIMSAGADDVEAVISTLNVLLKNQGDIDVAERHLRSAGTAGSAEPMAATRASEMAGKAASDRATAPGHAGPVTG